VTARSDLPTGNRPVLSPPPGRSGPPGGWLLLIAFLAALILCITASIAYYLNPSADREPLTSPGPPPLTAPTPTTTPAGVAAEPAGTDVTVRFREFALVGEKYPPEWLVRTKRVYWSADGSLWADATMPRNARERAFTIESICEELSAYVMEVVRRDWPGVSVRSEKGAELITKAGPADSCRPGL
jgi:hypothetical protein